jgi:hypothetical protein
MAGAYFGGDIFLFGVSMMLFCNVWGNNLSIL